MNRRLRAITNQAGLPAAFPVRTSFLLMRALWDYRDAAAEPPTLGGAATRCRRDVYSKGSASDA